MGRSFGGAAMIAACLAWRAGAEVPAPRPPVAILRPPPIVVPPPESDTNFWGRRPDRQIAINMGESVFPSIDGEKPMVRFEWPFEFAAGFLRLPSGRFETGFWSCALVSIQGAKPVWYLVLIRNGAIRINLRGMNASDDYPSQTCRQGVERGLLIAITRENS
ncbi:hypothetical protein HZF05_11835 [Sphingomonas sp. CGMCC 1.13654]|uniref:Uncharacterized protein n=1 Tax=Sphingomonas chungangi TaxID=2683589 RepID=A0A838L6W8_9SPHN|nr:hypothetical protein [Sphingomonas chungangi]MBA2934787.1 hypothetical protein [Sphingomonas chungangi]MVW58098.1 hypothetical protein [Sphingomonas chungangi]